MARLKCHGRELLRIERETETPAGDLTTWHKVTRAYMADGKILEKYDCKFKPDQFEPRGRFYSYGWKLKGKLKPGFTMPEHVAGIVSNINAKPDTRWKILSGNQPAAVIISQARILRAVESGDMLGFCKACGAEVDGVEPDARNYRCESCGMLEVYGAEEMLIASA